LGGPGGLAAADEAERAAAERLQAVLDRLTHLDAVDEPATRARFRATLAAELEAVPARVGRLGRGVLVGPLPFALGQDLDLLVVVGAADGLLPGSARADA